jgi:hypothetical protein
MAETPTSRKPGDDADGHAAAPPSEVTPLHQRSGTPRWVKVFAIVGIVVVVLVIVMLFTGHGPGRHTGGMNHAAGPTAVLGAPHDRPGFDS